MVPRVGLIGRGYWGNTYASVLREMGLEFWQAGRDWRERETPTHYIVASSTPSHFGIARELLTMGFPVLIEKPACLTSKEAMELIQLGGIAAVSHTRLYNPNWPAFRESLPPINSVEAWAGGVNETNPDAFLNWTTHLVPMCIDIGFSPRDAVFHITEEKQPLRFVVNGDYEFRDSPGALKNMITKFLGASDNVDLYMAYLVARYQERHR